jgi:hypothetical protein
MGGGYGLGLALSACVQGAIHVRGKELLPLIARQRPDPYSARSAGGLRLQTWHQLERQMKALLVLACACLLCSCSSAPVMHSSLNGYSFSQAPTSASDPRMQRPQFYMDESVSMPWLKATPQPNR